MMHWELEYMPQYGVVAMRTFGTVTPEELLRMAGEALTLAAPHKAVRFLLDHREADFDFRALEIYNLLGELEKIGMKHGHKVATVYSPATASEENLHFFNNRAFNKSHNHALFTDRDAALDWLAS